jgi:hypothetical protein
VVRGGVDEAGLGERGGFAGIGQRMPVLRERATIGLAAARFQQVGEGFGHHHALRVELGLHRRRVLVSKTARDAQQAHGILGQRMHLLVAEHLHAVLEPAQEAIGLRQPRRGGFRQVPGLRERRQRRQQRALAQRRFAPAADQLHRLHEELYFADAARPELEVGGQFSPLHLRVDHRLHLAQSVERGVVEVTPVDEGAQGFEQFVACADVAGHGPRLDPGVAFPVTALALVVLLHRRETQRQPTRGAEGPQSQVDAVAESVGGDVAQQLRQALANAREVFLGRERSRTVASAVLGEGVDEVDVGRKVELAAAELAQAEHHERSGAAATVIDAPVPFAHRSFHRGERAVQRLFGDARAARERLLHRIQARQVAPDQSRRLRRAPAAQGPGPVGIGALLQQGWR